MSGNFSEAYSDLTEFIRNHPEVEIGDSVTSIPDTVRAEFYRKFNATRDAFVEQQFPSFLGRAQRLQENYRRAETTLAGLIALEESASISRVQRFLQDFKDSMTRELFDPLFDLLKGRDTIGTFGQKSSEKITALWPTLYRAGYEKWTALSFVRLLEPDRALRVNIRPLNTGERARSASYAPVTDVPAPEESASFFFSQPRNTILTVPDLIVRSARLNRFVGIRSEFSEGLYNAFNASNEREWYAIDTDLLISLESGLTLIYAAENPEQIALIADVTRFCRPDMVLWCVDSQSIDQQQAIEKIQFADGRLNPRVGSFVIANEPWVKTGELDQQLEQNSRIRILDVGFDEFRLTAVIDALMDAEAPAVT